MARVTHFGALGDGRQDDTAALRHAVADGDGVLTFPRGTYLLRETVEIDLGRHGPISLRGEAGTARILMTGPGPAFRLIGQHAGTAEPASVKPETWRRERFPVLAELEIQGGHPEADGVELRGTMQATLERLLIRQTRHGVRLVERNRNVLLLGCHIYDNLGVGVFLDRCNLHQMIVSACHISYCREAGLKSLDGDLHNLQISGCDIEYNYDQTGRLPASADLWFDARNGMASEVAITGNTIQARVSPGGANLRIQGHASQPADSARLFTVSGNVLGSQSTNIELRHVERLALTGNTIYDGKAWAIDAIDCTHLTCAGNTLGWNYGPERGMSDSLRFERCRGLAITGCTLPDGAAGDEQAGAAVQFLSCLDSSLSGCQILDPAVRGAELRDCRRCRVSDNTFASRRAIPAHVAVRVVGGRDNLVQHNLIGGAFQHAVEAPPEAGLERGNHIRLGDLP